VKVELVPKTEVYRQTEGQAKRRAKAGKVVSGYPFIRLLNRDWMPAG
jgi:hypothetical protein